jgi:hypothetical protein
LNLILSNSRDVKPGIRRRTLSSRIEIGTFSLMIVAVLLALAISLLYLAHANRTATRGYAIKKLEIEKNELTTDLEIWDQQVSEARALETIKNSPVVRGMVSVRNPEYVRANISDLAE